MLLEEFKRQTEDKEDYKIINLQKVHEEMMEILKKSIEKEGA